LADEFLLGSSSELDGVIMYEFIRRLMC
jgi:hypothetical protein